MRRCFRKPSIRGVTSVGAPGALRTVRRWSLLRGTPSPLFLDREPACTLVMSLWKVPDEAVGALVAS